MQQHDGYGKATILWDSSLAPTSYFFPFATLVCANVVLGGRWTMYDCRSAKPPWGGLGSSPARSCCIGDQVFRGLAKSPSSHHQEKGSRRLPCGSLAWPSGLTHHDGGSCPGADKSQGWGLWEKWKILAELAELGRT